jgi:hypothetical protein
MKMRIGTVLLALMPTSLLAQQADSVAKIGDMVIIEVTGDLAKDVAKRLSKLPEGRPLDGLKIQMAAHVRNVSPDGTLYVEYLQMMRDEKPVRLMTLAGNVDPRKITTDITPKGTQVFDKPEGEPKFTTEDYLNRRLALTDLKGFKLRTWTLAEELGE